MYTVKELSRLAGVTPRTLHYYDAIGLLKPERVGSNGYRDYGEGDVLRLQQILFFRELDLPLAEIRQIMLRADFDPLAELERHRQALGRRIGHLQHLILTVEATISFLKGEKEMSNQQLFDVFNEEQQAEYEKEAVQRYDPEIVRTSRKKWKNYTTAEKQRIGEEGNAAYAAVLSGMPHGAASPEAQTGVALWRKHMDYFWTPSLEQLLGLAEMYVADPRFKANFDRIDPRLAEFMLAAVRVYVQKNT